MKKVVNREMSEKLMQRQVEVQKHLENIVQNGIDMGRSKAISEANRLKALLKRLMYNPLQDRVKEAAELKERHEAIQEEINKVIHLAKIAFCESRGCGVPRDTCTSLGTCDEHDAFARLLREKLKGEDKK